MAQNSIDVMFRNAVSDRDKIDHFLTVQTNDQASSNHQLQAAMDSVYQKLRQQHGFLEQRQCLQESLIEIASGLRKTKAKSKFIDVNLNLVLFRFMPTHLELCRYNQEPEHTKAYNEFKKLRLEMKNKKEEKGRIDELQSQKLDLQMSGHIAMSYLAQGKEKQMLTNIVKQKTKPSRSDSVDSAEMNKIINTNPRSIKGYYTDKTKSGIKNVNDFCKKALQKTEILQGFQKFLLQPDPQWGGVTQVFSFLRERLHEKLMANPQM